MTDTESDLLNMLEYESEQRASISNDHAFARATIADMTSQLSALRERLDRALVASEAANKAKHDANNRAQRLLGVAESAVRELVRAGASDGAARVQELIRAAMEML